MSSKDLTIRPMLEADLAAADRVFRLAFGTFLGVEQPESFGGDGDCITTRWRANPARAFLAVTGQEVIGSVLATNWGSVGFFGPLTVRPDYWDGGVGKRLIEPVMDLFDHWQIKHAGLYTFPNSPKHLGLYQRFGFWPRFLTLTMTKQIRRSQQLPHVSRFAELSPSDRETCLSTCRELTDSVHEGLDVREEIESVASQALGDTVLLWEPGGSRLAALAVCHIGPGAEAGSGTCYVKFAAALTGPIGRRAVRGASQGVRGPGCSSRGVESRWRNEHRPRRGLPDHARERLPCGVLRRHHAPAQRAGVLPPGSSFDRRLEIGRDCWRIRSVGDPLFEEAAHKRLKAIVLVVRDGADDFPLLVDHEDRREAGDAVSLAGDAGPLRDCACLGRIGSVQKDMERQLAVVPVGFPGEDKCRSYSDRDWTDSSCNRDDRQRPSLELPVHLGQAWHCANAGTAPVAPEVEDDYFAAEIGESHRTARVEIDRFDLRRWISDHSLVGRRLDSERRHVKWCRTWPRKRSARPARDKSLPGSRSNGWSERSCRQEAEPRCGFPSLTLRETAPL